MHTPGPWKADRLHPEFVSADVAVRYVDAPSREEVCTLYGARGTEGEANARLIAAAPELLAVLHEGRRAIGDHFAPDHCYATGPVTGDAIRDLIQCPACSFIAMYDIVIAKATVR